VIRVLLAEDQLMFRTAVRRLLELEGDIAVVAEVARGDELVAAALASRPDVAVVDIELPAQDGISAAAELRRRLPGCRTLILTMYGRPGYLQRALAGGVAGFVLKDAPVEALAAAIRRCAAGEDVVDASLATRALRAGPCPLSPREREILVACSEGLSTAEIATRVWLSEGTVRNRVSEILGKLGVRTRGEAVQLARENGWL
jgi:two-component system, NarL family, response regulator DesR